MTADPKSPMHASCLGQVDLDSQRLAAELAVVDSEFPFNVSYNRYASGNPGWKNCVLRNDTGDYNDIVFQGSYAGSAQMTDLGRRTPYVNEIVDRTFKPDHLKWARIFWCHNGLLMPHRDYLDIEEDDFTRIHVVLQTDLGARHSEEDKCYHMRPGEIWFVDGKYMHCAAAYSKQPRMNVVMDFEPGVPFEELFVDSAVYDRSIEPQWLDRKPFTDDDMTSIRDLHRVANRANWTDIAAIVGKVHLYHDVSVVHCYDWLLEIAELTGDQDLIDETLDMRMFFIGR